MQKYFMGIDIGTFESKGILMDEQFSICGTAVCKHGMDNPKPGWFEHDANRVWWQDFCLISHSLIKEAGIQPEQIAGVGASTLGTDCLAVDKECRPLRPAILYGIYARATEEITHLNEYYGREKVLQLFGHPLCSGDTATKILWIKRHEPEVYAKTYKFLTGSSFITAKLTGNYVIDQALGKGSYRPIYRQDGTIDEVYGDLYCRPDQMAECRYSTELAGKVTTAAAAATGLAPGTPVIVGTGDSTSEAISVGLVEPGDIFFQYGSSMFFYYCLDHPVESYQSRQGHGAVKGSRPFTVPGTYSIGDGTNAAGTLTRWVRDLLYASELKQEEAGGENAYQIMAREAAEVPAGSEGLLMLPYIYGERSPLQDPKASGVLFGLTGKHTRKHINRAALEAVGYSTYQHIQIFKEMGLEPKRVVTAGGGTKNLVWMQIICDILGQKLIIPEHYQSSCYGDALMAALGVGYLRDYKDLRKVLPKGTVLNPDTTNHAVYERNYPHFVQLYLQNKKLMHLLKEENDAH